MIEVVLIIIIALFGVLYYIKTGPSFYQFIVDTTGNVYDRYAPYSFKTIREKTKEDKLV